MADTHYVQGDSASSTNTILIVLLIIVILGLAFWWFTSAGPATVPDDNDLNVDVDLPSPTIPGGASGGASGGTTYP